jgi:GxxExxY protein
LGAAMEVHRVLGHGFLEPIYPHALAIEFELRGIPFAREAPLRVNYKGRTLDSAYKVDFLCFDDLLVELKALSALTNVETGIVLNYLKASGLERALLINFGAPSLGHNRLVWSKGARANRTEDPQIYTD